VSIIFHRIYEPVAAFALRFKKTVIAGGVIVIVITVFPFMRLGSEFMPPLYEGTLFYMPVTVPAASISVARDLLQLQDKLLKEIPEVSLVFGKAGRAETATDPAPLEMFETVINLKPESQWRAGMTVDKLKDEMNDKLTIPGVANSFTMPIKARIDMLATGIRTPVGIKVLAPNLDELDRFGREIEHHVREVPGTRSVYSERITTGYFLDFQVRRDEAVRYGLNVEDVQQVIEGRSAA
jgi:copper/silver efflux system protein